MQKARQIGARRLRRPPAISTRLQVETIMHSATPGHSGQGARGLGQIVARDGDPLAQLDGRGLVVHADERQRHCGTEPVNVAEEVGGPDGQHDHKNRAGEISGLAAAQAGACAEQAAGRRKPPT